jgi:DNA polymerase III subunit beta
MHCTTTREQLLEPVTLAEKSVGKNHTLPLLACIRIKVEGTLLTVTATNLEVGVEYTIQVGDAEDGVIAVSGSVLAHVLSALPSGTEITLTATKGFLEVVSANGASRIAIQDADEYPALPQVIDGVEVSLPAKELREVITGVAYCASPSTIKPELASIFVSVDGGILTAVATDSFRLAEKRVPLKQPVMFDSFLIPARSIQDLVRMLDRAQGLVVCRLNGHQLALSVPGAYITLRLTSGTFPDYTAIMPKEFVTEATVLVFDFERALRKALVFSDQFNQTTLTLAPKKKQFTIHTENTTVGETTDTVAASVTGDDLTIRFNQRYLLDAIQPVSTDSIQLQFAGQSQSAIIRPVGDDSFRYLVMPMNR